MRTKWEEVLSQEIAIKYKSGIYSLCHLLYCALYLLSQQRDQIGLLQLAEIVLLAGSSIIFKFIFWIISMKRIRFQVNGGSLPSSALSFTCLQQAI